MENASKALIMAGGVLVALMIIGALVLMFNSLSSYQNSSVQDTRDSQVLEFNNQYTGFARNNVRGSEVYSLLNKVVDYNKRESTAGTGKDNGQYVGYKPMTVTVIIKAKDMSGIYIGDIDKNKRLIKQDNSNEDVKFTASGTTNSFSNVMNTVTNLESKYGIGVLNKLVSNSGKIFIDEITNTFNFDNDQIKAVEEFNKISNTIKATDYVELNINSDIRKDVYQYGEYVQFKRCRFDCTGTEYDNKTGRIIKMTFESNGKFE